MEPANSDAQASVYLWVGVAIGVYVRAQVGKPGSQITHKDAGQIVAT